MWFFFFSGCGCVNNAKMRLSLLTSVNFFYWLRINLVWWSLFFGVMRYYLIVFCPLVGEFSSRCSFNDEIFFKWGKLYYLHNHTATRITHRNKREKNWFETQIKNKQITNKIQTHNFLNEISHSLQSNAETREQYE